MEESLYNARAVFSLREMADCLSLREVVDCVLLRDEHGRRPRGTGDDPPKIFRWGDGQCIRPPNIEK